MKNIIIIMSSTIDNNKIICHYCDEKMKLNDIIECNLCHNEICDNCHIHCEYCDCGDICMYCCEKYHNCSFCCNCNEYINENDTIRYFCNNCKFNKDCYTTEDIHKTCTECFIHLLLKKKLIPCDTCGGDGYIYWRNND